tara:strand:+ start:412 stop:633 length:222 start_codon:yes stop_codon:yes gene_type:complete
MDPKSQRSSALCAHLAQMAVRDWLETQARVTGYWRDVLLSSGGSEELIAVLDHHADVLAAAARLDSAEPVFAH